MQQISALIGDEQATLLKIYGKNGMQGCEFLLYSGHIWQRESLMGEESNFQQFPYNFF